MKVLQAILLLGAAVVSSAAPTRGSDSEDCNCRNIIIPVEAQAQNRLLPPYPNATGPGAFLRYLGSYNSSNTPINPVQGTFKISATYCEPTVRVKGRENTIQLLLHGLTATKEYWNGFSDYNVTFDRDYSWVAYAQSQGYSTLAIDSLGNGQSDHPDPIQTVQATLQVAITQKIIQQLRNGTLPHVRRYQKIVLASHSYGGTIARIIAVAFPTRGADTYIFTSTSNNATGLNAFIATTRAQSASLANPAKFGALQPGYQAIIKESVRTALYPLDGQYDPKVLQFDQSLTHNFAVGEIGTPRSNTPSNFTGPVLVLTGRQDQIVCGNGNITSFVPDCGVVPNSNPDTLGDVFPKASQFNAIVPDQSAHNINTQYTAYQSFVAAHSWLQSVGF